MTIGATRRVIWLSKATLRAAWPAADELASKGVPEDVIEREMESYPINDIANILTLMERRFCPEDLQDDMRRQKIFGYFMRKGFNFSDVKEAIRRFSIDDDTQH